MSHNSLRMFVQDAAGGVFLFTCASNRPGQAAAFKRHAAWWLRSGYKSAKPDRWPCMPCRVVVEPYTDETAH